MATDSKRSLIELKLRPIGWESDPETERLPISLLGHIMPKIYVLITEVFPLSNNARTDEIITSLSTGLEMALSQFPVLTGDLDMNTSSGEMWVTKRRDSSVSLFVKRMLDIDFPSYDELEENNFPPSLMNGSELLPESVTAKQLHSPLGDNSEEGIPISVFQVTFIRGGLVLGVAIHHTLSDGPGCDNFLATWAEISSALARGDQYTTEQQKFNLAGSALDVEKPTKDYMTQLMTKYPMVKDAGGSMPPPPTDFKMPPLVQQMWHFPRSSVEKLKVEASSEVGGSWISTYDSVVALLWSSITRAKLDLLKPDLDSRATLIHAVDSRSKWSPPLPEKYLGVGACPARPGPLMLKEIIAPGNLSTLAVATRQSISVITSRYLTGLIEWVAGHEDKRYLGLDMNSFLGMDLGISSWQGMTAYERHDFGFGLPKALRWPSPQFEGFVFLYPSRVATKGTAADEGIEACVCLEKSCHERLMKDEAILKFAQPRGL